MSERATVTEIQKNCMLESAQILSGGGCVVYDWRFAPGWCTAKRTPAKIVTEVIIILLLIIMIMIMIMIMMTYGTKTLTSLSQSGRFSTRSWVWSKEAEESRLYLYTLWTSGNFWNGKQPFSLDCSTDHSYFDRHCVTQVLMIYFHVSVHFYYLLVWEWVDRRKSTE